MSPHRPRHWVERSASLAPLLILSALAAAPAAGSETRESVRLVPLPVYATQPNEGPTYGVMPVFLFSDAEDPEGRILRIVAPSATWNPISRYTFTGRYYGYPSETEYLELRASASTRVARRALVEWSDLPPGQGQFTRAFRLQYEVDPYRRFFGIGKDSGAGEESAYTMESLTGRARVGKNVTGALNVGANAGVSVYRPRGGIVAGIPSSLVRFAGTPGVEGSQTLSAGLGFDLDTRARREFSTEGYLLSSELGAAASSSRSRSRPYGYARLEGRVLWEETSWAYGAARALWSRVYGQDVPFYERPSLGGPHTLRGYTLDRFVDDAAWTLDLEQRLTVAVLRIYGSIVHLRLDPFVSLGQVYDEPSEAFSRVRFTHGVGFRAFVPKNVLGRVDVARAEGAINTYVEIGYSF